MQSVIGQDKVVSRLRDSLGKNRLSHAYLIVGPPGVGKGTLALAVAQILNCKGEERPCEKCSPCHRIGRGVHPDVQVMGLERVGLEEEGRERMMIGIGQVNDMLRASSLPPYEGRYKVFIIDGADYLSDDAANRLLKTLEEPPPRVVFLLLAKEKDAVLPTVVSRCQVVELFPPPPHVVEKALVERWGVEEGRARLLARLSGGCPGQAIAALTQKDILERRSARIDKILELLSSGPVERLAYAADLASLFFRDRQAAKGVLCLWVEWWRDLLLTKAGRAEDIINIDRGSVLVQEARGYTLGQIRGFISETLTALEQLDANVNSRLVLEWLMLRLPPKNTPEKAPRFSGVVSSGLGKYK